MSTLRIEERITVSAPPARVWKFILDPARVAPCLPGARLDGTEGEGTFLGTMKVKVGPVMMELKGKATMTEVVPEERRVTLTGTGNDKSGGGSAKMALKSRILPVEGGGSEILVTADVDLAGKMVRFGRGMMEGISKQLFKQFSERVRAALESEPDDDPDAKEPARSELPPSLPPELEPRASASGPEPRASASGPEPHPARADAAQDEAPAPTQVSAALTAQIAAVAPPEPPPAQTPEAEATASPPREGPPTEPAAPPEADEAPATVASPSPSEPTSAEAAPRVKVSPAEAASAPANAGTKAPSKKAALAPAPADNAPLDAGSLVWAAIWAWFKGLFSRIFGKKS